MKRTMVCLTITLFLTGCILKSPTRALAQAERIELYGAYNSGLTFNQLVEYITELKPEEIAAIQSIATPEHFSANDKVRYASPFAYLKVYLKNGMPQYYGIDYNAVEDKFMLYYSSDIRSMPISAYTISIIDPEVNKEIKRILTRYPGSNGSEYQNIISTISRNNSDENNNNNRVGIIPLLWAENELRSGFVFRQSCPDNADEQLIFIWKDGNQYNLIYNRNRNFKCLFSFTDDLSSYTINSTNNFSQIQHFYRNGVISSAIKEQYFNPDQKFREYRIEPEKLSPLPLAPQEMGKYILPLFTNEPTSLKHIADSGDLELMQYGENQIVVNADNGMIYRIEFIPSKNTCLISVKYNDTTFMQISIKDNQIIQFIGNEQEGFTRTEFDNSNCTLSYINNHNGEWLLRETHINKRS